jgi:hypothetical protein
MTQGKEKKHVIYIYQCSSLGYLCSFFPSHCFQNCGDCVLQIDSGEDAQEEFGWKLVHGDVFRPPRKGMLISVLLGSGTQVFCMSLITLGKIMLSTWK